ADGYLRLAECIWEDFARRQTGHAHGEAFNFGTGYCLSPLPLLNLIVEAAQLFPDLRPRIEKRKEEEGRDRSKEIAKQEVDSSKARRVLGWESQWDMKRGL